MSLRKSTVVESSGSLTHKFAGTYLVADHRVRDDFSRFLVHLTRDYSDGSTAESNLIAILQRRRIEARNSHCLFSRKIEKIGFSEVLKRQFQTVCFTEVPLSSLRHLVKEIPGRNIKLKPYGLVFWKSILLDAGANPAIYISSKSAGLRELLLSQFDEHFKGRTQYKQLKSRFGGGADAIIRYYAFINIISESVDFSWEREWRLKGDYTFGFETVVAIIAPDPAEFRKICMKRCGPELRRTIARVPVVSPDWNYEQLVEEMAMRIWESR